MKINPSGNLLDTSSYNEYNGPMAVENAIEKLLGGSCSASTNKLHYLSDAFGRAIKKGQLDKVLELAP